MSEEISKIARVYQFLSDYGEQWKDAADQCGYADGVVTKAEFRAFMLGSDFEWANEDSDSAKRDLINQFWNTIDTKRSGRVAGSSKSNLDALDKDEVNKMQEKIEIYDAAIAFAATLSLPEGASVNDYSAWVKKVKESILSRVEKFIKDGGKLENLQEFLEAQGQEAVVITTADMIAQDLIKEKVGNIPNYGGYDTDETLHRLIDNYVNSLKQNPNISGAEISETITRLVNAYVSTLDGMPSESDIELLKQYGYPINDKSNLNDLQKAVLSNSLTEKLAKIKVGDDYDKYPELFDKAIEEFINSLLSDTKMADFAAVKNYGIPEFEASEAYKGLKVKLQVSKFFSSDTFKNKLKEELGETIADKIGNSMKGDFPALDKIIEDALKLAADGSFGNPIDENKLAEWAIKQVKAKLAEFFKDLDNLSLQEMNTVYKALETSAIENQSLENLKKAAILYCSALAKKNAGLANMMKDLCKTRLGKEDYTSAINSANSNDIQAFMTELTQKALEIGDKHSAEITGGPTDSDMILAGGNSTFAMQAQITSNGTGSVDYSEVHYGVTNVSGGSVTIDDSGKLKITAGNSAGYVKAKVVVTYYGNIVGTKDISIKIQSIEDAVANAKWSSTKGLNTLTGFEEISDSERETMRIWGSDKSHNNQTLSTSNMSFADLYNGNYNIELGTTSKKDKVNILINRISNIGNIVIEALANAGFDKQKLTTAAQKVNTAWIAGATQLGELSSRGTDSDQRNKADSTYNKLSDGFTNGQYHGITYAEDGKGNNQFVVMFNFKEYVDAIIEEYKKL